MRRVHILTCLVLLVVFARIMVLADNGPGISGQLVFPDIGVNCDSVEMTLEQSFGLPFRRTYTDLSCNFDFSDVGVGSYVIGVAIPGYEAVRQPVRIVNRRVMRRVTVHMNRTAEYSGPYGDFMVDASEILDRYPKKAVRLYEESIENRKKGESDKAAQQLEQAVQIAPTFYNAHRDLGTVYKDLGRLDDALRHLWRARELNTHNADPLIAISAIYLERNELEEAERVSNLAVDTDSRSASAFFNLGIALYRRLEIERAEDTLLKALSLAPEALEIRLALVNVYGKLGRFDSLLQHLDQYLEHAPSSDERRSEAERLREQVLKIKEQTR
jgi:Flp pilus assembly protein TadD